MKIAIIFPFFRTSDSTFDGPPLSSPILVGNIKNSLPGNLLTQIDLNREILTAVGRGLFPGKEYEDAAAYVKALARRPGMKVSGYAGYRSIESFTDNRLAADYHIPGEGSLRRIRKFLDHLSEFSRLGEFDHYFLTVYKANEPDVIASLLLARYLKNRYPAKKIILGGYRNFSAKLKNEIDHLDFIDSLVIGVGERSMKEILAAISGNKKIKKTYEVPVPPEELLGLPDYESFRNLDFFRIGVGDLEKKYGLKFERKSSQNVIFIPYTFTLGCFWGKCRYCGESGPGNKPFTSKSADEIVNDIEKLKKICRSDFFIFYNNNFNSNTAFSKALLRKMIARKLNILWTDSFNLVNLDDEMIGLLAEAGCIRMDLGVSIADPKLQRFYNNILRNNRLLDNLPKIHRAGIWVDINIIANVPFSYSAEEDIKALYRYLPYVDSATLNSYRAYNSDIFCKAAQYGLSAINRTIEMDTGVAPMYFLENEFRGSVGKRMEMFRQSYLSWEYILDKHEIINNRKHFYLLGLLYKKFGRTNKKKIREYMLQANSHPLSD